MQNRFKSSVRFLLCNSGFSWKEDTPVSHPTPEIGKQIHKLDVS